MNDELLQYDYYPSYVPKNIRCKSSVDRYVTNELLPQYNYKFNTDIQRYRSEPAKPIPVKEVTYPTLQDCGINPSN